MEKTLDKAKTILDENERVIANILHDIKSPVYSIKIALQTKLDNELNRDIYETASDIIKYIENFLVNYNFKTGKFNNKISECNIKEIINKKIENYKYIFLEKNIQINIIDETRKACITNSIRIFLSSILGNIISNIAFHASKNSNALIKLEQNQNFILINFQNEYEKNSENFSLGLDFCKKLSTSIKAEISFTKTNSIVNVCLKIPDLA